MNTWQLTWRLIRAHPWVFAASTASWLVVFHTALVPGLVSKMIFDNLTIGTPMAGSAWMWILLMVFARLVRVALQPVAAWIYVTHRYLLGRLLRLNLLERVFRRPGAAPLPRSAGGTPIASGEAISRFRDDVEHIVLLVADITVDTTGIVIRSVVVFAIMLSINARIAVLAVLPLVLISVTVNASRRRLERYRRASREASGAVSAFLGEMFDKAQAVKVGGAEEHVARHFDRLNERRRRADLKDTFFSEVLGTALGNTQEIATTAVLILASRQMAAGQFTVGDLALFVYLLPTVTHSLDGFAQLILDHRQTAVSLARLQEMSPEEPVARLMEPLPAAAAWEAGAAAAEPICIRHEPLQVLEIAGLTSYYPGTERGVKEISFDVKRGSYTVITGRVGSGKSTLLPRSPGDTACCSGEVRWNGAPVNDAASFFVPPRCAYTAQVPRLFSQTVRENILLGWPGSDAELDEAVQAAVLAPDLAELEHGLDTVVGCTRRQAFRGPGPAGVRGAHVPAPPTTARGGRSLQRAGCAHRSSPLGAA